METKETLKLSADDNGSPQVQHDVRNSSVELVKILAMFMIVISHVAQTLGSPHPELSYPAEIFFDSMHSARDFQHFVILIFRHFGSFGNNLFFISSAWFLCGSKKSRSQRIFQILCDVWILSVLSLAVSLASGVHLPKSEIAMILLPSTFEINWYTTCYVCFLAVLPLLNIVIEKLDRRNFLKVCVAFGFFSFGICCIRYIPGVFNNLILFSVVFLCVSYCKKYLAEKCDDFKLNLKIFLISLFLLFVLILATNLLGFKIGFFEHNAIHWARNNNPLIILAAFSLFNLARRKTFYSKAVIHFVAHAFHLFDSRRLDFADLFPSVDLAQDSRELRLFAFGPRNFDFFSRAFCGGGFAFSLLQGDFFSSCEESFMRSF